MGAKTWMLVYASNDVPGIFKARPAIDRDASTALANKLFPKHQLTPLADGTLTFACPPDDEVMVSCFPGVSVVAAADFGIDYPSKLPKQFLDPATQGTAYLHAMHSVVDWFAFAVWKDGSLQRALSLSPDSGIIENIGDKLAFELPYWEGNHPAVDPTDEEGNYPFPFHPLDLGEAALANLFGYQLEGEIAPDLVDPEHLPMMRFKRSKTWWKLW
jgi:hypothetical protein